MRRKKWKKGRTILPLLLSAILIAEPLATTATVYAEELDATEGMEQKEDLGEEETLPDSGEEIKGDTGNGTEDGTVSDDVQENEKDSEGQDGSDDASGTENKDQQDEPSEQLQTAMARTTKIRTMKTRTTKTRTMKMRITKDRIR